MKKNMFEKLEKGLAALKGEGFEQEPAYKKTAGDYTITVREEKEPHGKDETRTSYRVGVTNDGPMMPCCGSESSESEPKASMHANATCYDEDKAKALAAGFVELLEKHGFAEKGDGEEEDED